MYNLKNTNSHVQNHFPEVSVSMALTIYITMLESSNIVVYIVRAIETLPI